LISNKPAAFAEVRVKMNEAPLETVNVTMIGRDYQSVTLQWDPIRIKNGELIGYDVMIDMVHSKTPNDFPTSTPRFLQVS